MISHSWQRSIIQTGKEILRTHNNKSRGEVPSNTHFTCKKYRLSREILCWVSHLLTYLGRCGCLPTEQVPLGIHTGMCLPLQYRYGCSLHCYCGSLRFLQKKGKSARCSSGSCQTSACTPGWLTSSMASAELEGSSTVSLLSRKCNGNLFLVVQFPVLAISSWS